MTEVTLHTVVFPDIGFGVEAVAVIGGMTSVENLFRYLLVGLRV